MSAQCKTCRGTREVLGSIESLMEECPDCTPTPAEAREMVRSVMIVRVAGRSHPMTCAGVSAKGPIQASGMPKYFFDRERCDCPPANAEDARLAAFEEKVRAEARARVKAERDAAIYARTAIEDACRIIETGDQRLLAGDGPAGGRPPDITLAEWRNLYVTLDKARKRLWKLAAIDGRE